MGFSDADLLIGREHDLAALAEVRARGRRLITIVGPGGVGKTQFAKAALHGAGDDDLVCFVDLTRAKSSDGVLSEIGAALGMRIGDVRSSDAAKERIIEAVARRGEAVFVLDNLEHLTEHIRPLLQALLAGAPDARFIATSREPIGIRDEYRFELVPLEDDAAMALFIDRAHLARPDLKLSDDDESVARVVHKLSNLPLAIELAAARMEILSLEQLERRLATPLDLLKSSNPELSERHRTLVATMQWSWELLDPTEQRAMTWCSTFHGDFTLELCERLLPDDIDAVDALQSLKRKSLVSLRPGAEQRFFFLESVKAFATQKLAGHEDKAAAERAHALLFAEQGEALDPNREGDLARAPALQDDLIAMLFELCHIDGPRAARLLVHLMPFLNRTVVVDSHFRFYDRLLAADIDDETRAHLYTGRAQLAVESARLVDCERDINAALDLLEGPLGSPPVATAQALGVRAAWLTNNGRFEEARADIQRCLDALPPGTPAHAKALMRHFVTFLFEGRYDDAEPLGGRALLATERGGDKRDEIYILTNLAYLRAERGQLDDSRRDLLAAQTLAERFASENVQSILLFNLAWLELELENRERALTLCQELEERANRYGLTRLEGLGAVVEGIVRAEQGDLETAQDRLLHAEALSVEKDLVTRARFSPRAYRACVLARLGRTAEARSILEELDDDRSIAPHFADARRFLMIAAKILLRRADHQPEDDLVAAGKEKLSDQTPLGGPVRIARRWLVHVLATRAGRATTPEADAMGPLLKVGPDFHWFEIGGERTDIRRRGAMRRVFMSLTNTLDNNPGQALTLDEVLEAGWPGQTVSPEAGANRVYTVVRNLRRAGLEDVLLTRDDGYLIDPTVRVAHVEE